MSRFSNTGLGFRSGGAIVPRTPAVPSPRPQSSPRPTAAHDGPHPTYRFQVEISGITVAEFSECSGLEVRLKTEPIRQGGQNEFTHILPGRVEYGNLVLRRGFVVNSELFTWCRSTLNRQGTRLERKDVTVSLVAPTRDGTRSLFQWTFLGAYPVKWTGPAFKASDNGVAMETLELAHEGLR